MSVKRFAVLLTVLLGMEARTWALDPREALEQFGRQQWQTESGLPQNTVRAVLQTSDGYLWIATEGGLVRFDGLRFDVFDTQNTPALRSNRIQSLSEDSQRRLTIQTAEGSVALDFGVFHPATGASGGGEPLRTPPNVQDAAGRTWTATPEGLQESGGGTTLLHTAATGLPSNHANAVYRDREGTLWIGTDAGLVRRRDGAFERFPASDPLSSDVILSLFEDREGNLWIGTDTSGLFVLHDETFTALSSRTVGLDAPVRCVFADRSGTVWLGTDGNGVVQSRDGLLSKPGWNNALSSQVILSLAQDASGDLLLGTPDGLNRVHEGRVTVLTTVDGLPEDFVRSLLADGDGGWWLGTRRGLAHLQGGRVRTYTQTNGLGSDMVGALLRDSRGDLWAGTLEGLSRLHNGVWTTFTTAEGLSSNVITDLFSDAGGVLWIGTQGGGLDYIDGETVGHVPASAGLPDTIFGVAGDDRGRLWVASRTGIYRWHKSVGAAGSAAISYGTGDGLRVRECSGGGHPAVWRAVNGDLWFAMTRGAAELKASHLKRLLPAAPVVIERVSSDGVALPPGKGARLGPDQSHLTFEYAGLSFAAPQKVRYRYRLDPFDHAWVDAGLQRATYYTNLPPGRYTFRVLAENGDGVWSSGGAAFAFAIAPHYYQTRWFQTLLALALGSILYAAYRWRVRQVRERFDAVLGERNRIAREIHDTLAQGFIGVSVQLELVARLLTTSADAARAQLDETRALVRRSIGDARQAIWELRSQSSENRDFAARLANMAKAVTGSSGARVQMAVHGTFRPLAARVEDELFRIGQEAVTNSVRHGRATNITIELSFDTKRLRMTVSDDGCGFAGAVDSSGPEGHYGLKGMRERAAQIRAELHVESAVGKGTTVRVEAPAR